MRAIGEEKTSSTSEEWRKNNNTKRTRSLSMDSISNLKLQIRLHFIKNFIEHREYIMANGQLLLHLNKNPMPILLLAIGFALSMFHIQCMHCRLQFSISIELFPSIFHLLIFSLFLMVFICSMPWILHGRIESRL